MLGYNIVGFQICVPLSDEQWSRLLEIEEGARPDFGRKPISRDGFAFIKALEEAGAEDINWSGHYGQYLFFNARADFDTCEYGRSVVEQVIKKIEELL